MVHEGKITLPICFLRVFSSAQSSAPHGVVIACPINMAVVEVQWKSIAVASVCKLAHNVSPVRRVHDVIVALLCSPHRETIMVSRGESHIACTSLFEGFDPFLCIEIMGVEGVSGFRIFVAVEIRVLQIPFSLCIQGIDAPVEKYAEAIFGKLPTIFQILA